MFLRKFPTSANIHEIVYLDTRYRGLSRQQQQQWFHRAETENVFQLSHPSHVVVFMLPFEIEIRTLRRSGAFRRTTSGGI